jgi:hypothetical protein
LADQKTVAVMPMGRIIKDHPQILADQKMVAETLPQIFRPFAIPVEFKEL